MGRTTQQIRDAWSPACKARDVSLLDAYKALDRCFKKHKYAPKEGQTWGYNCRKITGGTGYSLHAYDPGERFVFWSDVAVTTAIAVDINSLANPYGPKLVTDMPRAMIDDILKIKTVGGVIVFKWGGYYSKNKDAMHFEIQASPAELARGIDWSTVPADEEDKMDAAQWAEFVEFRDNVNKHLGKYYGPINGSLFRDMGENADPRFVQHLNYLEDQIRELQAAVVTLQTGGVDTDALADTLAANLAARLQT